VAGVPEKQMKRVLVVQARMTSTRLPGKVLMDVAGRPMLAQQIWQLKQCSAVDEIVVATTTNGSDDPVVDTARAEGVAWFRGSEQDVLGRLVGAGRATRADVVVRVTGDCPLIDPQAADDIIQELVTHAAECDYACNVVPRTYPRGLDVEALFWDTLLRIDRLAQTTVAREHPTLVALSERPELFLRRTVTDSEDNSDLRWTVDTQADLEMVRALYDALLLGETRVSYRRVLAYVRGHPEIARINAGVETWTPA
jgi:spore coat polysaccharide biosynthesis protein SpsF